MQILSLSNGTKVNLDQVAYVDSDCMFFSDNNYITIPKEDVDFVHAILEKHCPYVERRFRVSSFYPELEEQSI